MMQSESQEKARQSQFKGNPSFSSIPRDRVLDGVTGANPATEANIESEARELTLGIVSANSDEAVTTIASSGLRE